MMLWGYNRKAMNDTPNNNYPERRCPQCGTKLNPDDRYCPLCGAAVEEPITSKTPGYCPKCGFYKDDVNAPCPHCGYSPNQQASFSAYQSPSNGAQNFQNSDPDYNKPIKGAFLGFLMGFFIGIIGLILCLILGDKACKKGCVITFIVVFIVEIILVAILAASGSLGFIY